MRTLLFRFLGWVQTGVYSSETITGRRFTLDWKHIDDCRFEDCHILFGGGPCDIDRIVFERCSFEFTGAAAGTAVFLKALARTDPAFVGKTLGI